MYGVRQYGMHTLLYFLTEVNSQHNTNMASNRITNMVSKTKTDVNINDILSFPLFNGQLLACTCNSIHYTGTFLLFVC